MVLGPSRLLIECLSGLSFPHRLLRVIALIYRGLVPASIKCARATTVPSARQTSAASLIQFVLTALMKIKASH